MTWAISESEHCLPTTASLFIDSQGCSRPGRGSGGFDAVIHLAALSNDPMGNLKPELTDQINHLASVRLAKLPKQAGVKRFSFLPHAACMAWPRLARWLMKTSPLRPLTAYAVSKVQTEEDVAKLADHCLLPHIPA